MPFISPAKYLELEQAAEYKSEYISGELHAMSGGSPAHAVLPLLIAGVLNERLRQRPCVVFNSDLLVGVSENGPFFYPDLSVLCGPVKLMPNQKNVLANPSVAIEVLSKSTEAYDRGLKFAHYQRILSLQEYVLVSQTEPRIEVFGRVDGNRWLLTVAAGLSATVELESIDCSFTLDEIYSRINLER